MNSYEKSNYSETKRLDFSQVHIEQFFGYLLLFDSLWKGLCGEI